MKFILSLSILLAALLAAISAIYPFLNQTEQTQVLTGLPWQIEVLENGRTQVFGINLGKSRLSDAIDVLGEEVEVAVIAATAEVGRLEMYYRSYRVGLLSGKLILKTSAAEQDINLWRDNALQSDYVATGRAKKYLLSGGDLTAALAEVISGIIFIPSVNLDEETILARFGQPDIRENTDGVTHFIYTREGLDIALSNQAKEVLEYSVPGLGNKAEQ